MQYDMVWPRLSRTGVRGHDFYCHAGRSAKSPGHTWGQPGRDLGMHGFLVLTHGAGSYRDGEGRQDTVAAGALFLLFPGLPHDYGPGHGQTWHEWFLDCDGGLPRLLEAHGLLDRRAPVLRPPADAVAPLLALIDGIERGRLADPDDVQLRLHAAVLALARWRRGGEDVALEAGRRVLAADPARPLDPRAAADAANMGWELFRKRFRARYGLPPARYRLHARCEAAAGLLAAGATVEVAAERLGFCDAAHLRRRFRRALGLAPEAWRRLHGGG